MDLRARRRAAGLSQSQLADLAGVPQPNLSAYETGRRTPSAGVLERLEQALVGRPSELVARHRSAVRDLVIRHHASSPRLVGSIARGEDSPGSDVDLLVEFGDEATLLDEVGLRLALTELLQVEVDVIAADTLRGDVRDRMVREAVPL